MNAAIQCIILLACTAVCSSSAVRYCRCIKTVKAVDPKLIADVKEYGPRAYCRKTEVIVILKNGTSGCLDPNEERTKIILERKRMHMMTLAAKGNTISPKTTSASATVSGTASLTESATASATVPTTSS